MKNLRKTLALVLSVIMLFSCMAAGTIASAYETEGNYIYYVENNEATIVSADSSNLSGNVVIPEKLGGYPVTAIGEEAFYYCTLITGIVIPDTVKEIGYDAFYGCISLKSVDTGDGVDEFPYEILDEAIGLEKIHFGKNVRIDTDDAYYFFDVLPCIETLATITVSEDNPYLDVIDGVLYGENKTLLLYYPISSAKTEYVMPAEVKGVFFPLNFAENLKKITYNAKFSLVSDFEENYEMIETLDYLDSDAAFIAEMLQYIIPANVAEISVNEEHPYLSAVENVLYNKDGSVLIKYAPDRADTSFEIGENVTWLSTLAFSGAHDLELTISDGFTENLDEFLEDFDGETDVQYAMEYFLATSSAKLFVVADTNKYLKSDNGVLYNKKMTDLIKYPIDSYGDYYELPESVRLENLIDTDNWETGAFASYSGNGLLAGKYTTASELTVHVSDATFEIMDLADEEDAYAVIATAFMGVKQVCTDTETINIKAYNRFINELVEIIEESEEEYAAAAKMVDALRALEKDIENGEVTTKQALLNYAAILYEGGMSDKYEYDDMVAEINAMTDEELAEMEITFSAQLPYIIVLLEEMYLSPEAESELNLMKALCVKMEACEGEHLYEVIWRNAPVSIKTPSVTEIDYGETLILHAEYTTIPEGAELVWTVTGEGVEIVPSEDGKTCAVISVDKGTATVKLTVVAENGTIVKDENGDALAFEQVIESNCNLWLKIVSFFKNLFGSERTIEQSIAIR